MGKETETQETTEVQAVELNKILESEPTQERVPNIEELRAEDRTQSEKQMNAIRRLINSQVAESKLPIEGGETSYSVYGGKLSTDPEGKVVYDMRLRHINHDIDRAGDRFLRSVEDHQMKKPLKTFLRNPIKFFNYVPTLVPFILTAPKSLRYRGEKTDILANVERLGLGEYYGAHNWGIEYKHPEILKEGFPLQDILRSYKLRGRDIDKIDKFDAILKAGALLNETHKEHGAVGEFNVYAVIFKGAKNGKAEDPILNLPTIIYNKEKQLGEKMKRATDLLDFIISVGSEEWNRDKTSPDVKKAMYMAITTYNDPDVIKMTVSLIKRGRLTLPRDEEAEKDLTTVGRYARQAFSMHNQQRLGIVPEASKTLREYALEVCEAKLKAIEVKKRNTSEMA